MTKKISVNTKTSKKEVVSRRKFMKGAAVAGVAAAGTLGVPNIPKAATVLKVQAAWGGGIFLENAKSYVDRVNKMAGGGLKIDLAMASAWPGVRFGRHAVVPG